MLRRLKTLAAAAAITYFVGWLRGRRSTKTRRHPIRCPHGTPPKLGPLGARGRPYLLNRIVKVRFLCLNTTILVVILSTTTPSIWSPGLTTRSLIRAVIPFGVATIP